MPCRRCSLWRCPKTSIVRPEFLNHVWAFDHPVVTEEDRNRNVYYAQQQEFGAEVRRAASLEDFMASLDLRVSIQPLAESKLPRVAQLTQRTNQFNLTTIRRTEAEIQAIERESIPSRSATALATMASSAS